MSPLLTTRTEGRVLVVEMARPQEGNALNRELQTELASAWRQLEANEELHAGVLHGGGRVFSVGHDVNELASGSGDQADPAPPDGLFPHSLSKPVIAAVEGECFGLGFELAMACDLRVAGEDARFGFPDTNLYVSYRLASALLPRITNLGASLDLLLTGNPMTASRLEQLRLVNRVTPPGQALNTAMDLAQDMVEHFGSATAFRKEQIWQFSGLPLPTALSLARASYNGG
jgi:enoyl-CoA hydratase